MNKIITDNIEEIKNLCSLYKVNTLFVFGSVCNSEFTDSSDIDFLITFKNEFPVEDSAEYYFNIYYKLQDLLHRKIDLTTEKSLTNPYLIKNIEQTKQLIYAG